MILVMTGKQYLGYAKVLHMLDTHGSGRVNVKSPISILPVWMIPTGYAAVTIIAGLTLPRLEHVYLGSYSHSLSVSSAQALFSAIASGMMAFTGIVFSLQFVRVTFGSMAYSPRVVAFLVRDTTLYHSLGIFTATFGFALATLAWTDRGGLGKVPLFSAILVFVLLILSMLAFGRLIQGVSDIQITRILQIIGKSGRRVVQEMFPLLDAPEAELVVALSKAAEIVHNRQASQTILYTNEPKVVGAFDIDALVVLAKRYDVMIKLECAVGDTLTFESTAMFVYGNGKIIPEADLRKTIKLVSERTFEQDPKYPIRLLVDIAIRALSPAVNDPTTAVQAIDQIEDILRRLGKRKLGTGYAADENNNLRVLFPTPTWDDYLALAFDEIRQYGSSSVQVMRRMRSALYDLAETLTVAVRQKSVLNYIEHINLNIERCMLDKQDLLMAMQEDKQGLGLSR